FQGGLSGTRQGPYTSGPQGAFVWRASATAPAFFVVPVFRSEVVGSSSQTSRETLLFSAETGALAHRWPDAIAAGAADLNGDGYVDLYGYDVLKNGAMTFRTLRGGPPEAWRRPGQWSHPGFVYHGPFNEGGAIYVALPGPDGDLDGDGVRDVLLFTP